MSAQTDTLAPQPFFLDADPGQRFCLYHAPEASAPARGAILFVHPFAEELNKSRRMVALQARAYAQAGFGVLQIDLYGCGDSHGDLAQARWDLWHDDLARAWQWLDENLPGPRYLWGLRLGALLALDFARHARPQALILWQPALSGRAHLQQFSRLQSAARLFSSVHAVEQQPEIGGYPMSAPLASDIASLDAVTITPVCPVHWMELSQPAMDAAADYARAAGNASPHLQPASELLVERWRQAGALVQTYPIHGEPFWNSSEIGVSSALLTVTTTAAIRKYA